MEKSNSMWKKMVTPTIKNDVADFWKKYKEEHGIGDNIVVVLLDIDRALTLELGRVMKLFIDEVLRQREYNDKSALQPKEDDEIE